jgi:regulator of cell morphogenesis and NO signaling
MIALEKTVGRIAAETPASIGVFEKFGIDYCCGGDRPFAEACRERGLAPEAVAAEIEAAGAASGEAVRDWTQAPLAELIDHILSRHHEYLRAELPALEQRMGKTLEAHGTVHGETLRALQQAFLELEEELYGHMHKEEMILFPSIREMEAALAQGRVPAPPPFGSVRNPIRVMRFEHDNAAGALERMRRLSANYAPPAEACATWQALYRGLEQLEADLHRHIHLENNILFPRAEELEAGRAAAAV